MRGNARGETNPEILVRSALHRRGLRFRKNARPVPGVRCRADVVFPRERVAVFLDGCYRHSCPDHGRRPETNSSYWSAKLARNVQRDRENDRVLEMAGWTVLRVWEHEDAAAAAQRIAATIDSRRRAVERHPKHAISPRPVEADMGLLEPAEE